MIKNKLSQKPSGKCNASHEQMSQILLKFYDSAIFSFFSCLLLGFIGADRKDNGVSIQLWLVFDYHRAGSLYDFLHEKTVDLKTMFEMVWSIVAGLDHLHKPIIGIVQKPAIAHRDLKTKNILVKAGGK